MRSDVTGANTAESSNQTNKRGLKPVAAGSRGEKEKSMSADVKRLNDLCTQLMLKNNVEEALDEVMRASAELLNADKASVQMYNEHEGALKLVSHIGFDEKFNQQFGIVQPDGITTCAAAIRSNERVLVEDFAADEQFTEFYEAAQRYNLSAGMSTPVYGGEEQLFGVFTMYWTEPHRPDPEGMELLELYTQQAARQIERKRANEALLDYQEQLEKELATSKLLQDISTQLIVEENINMLYKKILKAAVSIMDSDYASLQMFNPDREEGELRLLAHEGFSDTAIKNWEWVNAESNSACGMALRTGDRVVVTDVKECSFMEEEDLQMFDDAGIQAVQSTPLVSRNDQVLGMISTQWKEPYVPPEKDLGMLDILARQAADLIERKLAEERLQEMNETLEQRVEERTQSLLSYQDQLRSLASKLSKAEEQERHRLATELHDNLGQMLAVNKMKMDLLKKDQLPEQAVKELAEIKEGMNDAVIYTRNLMSDLKPPPSLDKEDVRASIEWLAQKMQKHDLEVDVLDDGEPKQASEDIRSVLLQSVRELLFNVIKHSGVMEARVYMSRINGYAHVKVKDEGKGFNLQEEGNAPDESGGFGLFNIRERMDLLGGHVEIESQPGEGTIVCLKAPLKKTEQIDEHVFPDLDDPDLPNKNDQKVRVLLADDHRMIREGLKKIVDNEEDMMVVGEAADGQEAVDLARQTVPDVIVMDVNMPRMNGIDATRQLLSSMNDVRVVGLSLHDHQEVINSMRDAGASAYLTKNEAFETLCATIRSEAVLAKK